MKIKIPDFNNISFSDKEEEEVSQEMQMAIQKAKQEILSFED